MRKTVRILLLGALFAVVLCGSAMAADTVTKGIVKDSLTGTGVTLTAKTAGSDAQASEGTVDGKTVYADAVRIGMTLNSTPDSSKEYLVFVLKGTDATPKEDNIVYIDQKSGTEAGQGFDLYPSSLSNGTYTICMATSSDGVTSVGSFDFYSSYTLGDVNGDGEILPNDATKVLNAFVGNIILNQTERLAADVTFDGDILPNDATRILNFFVGNITSFA